MAETTGISWAHSTWSPWRGCSKVSPGCAHCYAEAMSGRNPAVLGVWGPDGKRVLNGDWRKPRRWDKAAKKAGERRRVFPSLCDPFEAFDGRVEDVRGMTVRRSHFQETLTKDESWGLDDIRWEFFNLIRGTPDLDWLVLTKRPENSAAMMADYREAWDGLVLPNLWLGASVEDQRRADERIPHLLATPASVRWLSVEPLLGPIDLFAPIVPDKCDWLAMEGQKQSAFGRQIDWVVVGGESGPHARSCDIGWIRSIVAQCKAAGVPVFVKQLGSLPWDEGQWALRASIGDTNREYNRYCRIKLRHPKGGDPAEWPEDLRVREFPAA